MKTSGNMTRRSLLKSGAYGAASAAVLATPWARPSFAQSLPDPQTVLDDISVEKYVRADYRELYNMSNEPLW
ncbi:MAG: twin-arginine translocation signal domain-containing protein, partial [Rhodobacter sp.]|nr:twin-arginine translocation signal domain-containing protein [Rhodobacter sp.]